MILFLLIDLCPFGVYSGVQCEAWVPFYLSPNAHPVALMPLIKRISFSWDFRYYLYQMLNFHTHAGLFLGFLFYSHSLYSFTSFNSRFFVILFIIWQAYPLLTALPLGIFLIAILAGLFFYECQTQLL